MTARTILQIFENYQKARLCFVQAVSDLALRPQNIELLENAGFLGSYLVSHCQIIYLL